MIKSNFFKAKSGINRFEIVSVKLDDCSIKHINAGESIRIAFFLDKKVNLPWYKRDSMVITVGKNVSIDNFKNLWKNRDCKEGVIDKSYFKTSIDEINSDLKGNNERSIIQVGFQRSV
jgi:hypothetical protein